jgi:hypothetical protein
VVDKVLDSGEVRLVVVYERFLDVYVQIVVDSILRAKLVQIQQFFLQLGLLGVVVCEYRGQCAGNECEQKDAEEHQKDAVDHLE